MTAVRTLVKILVFFLVLCPQSRSQQTTTVQYYSALPFQSSPLPPSLPPSLPLARQREGALVAAAEIRCVDGMESDDDDDDDDGYGGGGKEIAPK